MDATLEPTGYAALDALLPRLEAIPTLPLQRLADERVALLGRKQGAITALLKTLPTLPPEQRPAFGAAVNRVKQAFEAAFETRERGLARAGGGESCRSWTSPSRAGSAGSAPAIR